MATYVFIILMTLFLISIYVLNSLDEYFFKQKSVDLLTRANVIAYLATTGIKFDEEQLGLMITNLKNSEDIRIIVTDKEAKVIFDNTGVNSLRGKLLLNEEVVTALKGKDGGKSHFDKEIGWIINAAVPIIKDRETIGVVYLTTSADDIMTFLKDTKQNLFAISVVVSILIGLLSFVMAGVITRPVEELTTVIQDMADGRLNQRVDAKGKDEIGQLGMAFNKMAERLNELEEKRRLFVSNASHELRTPLSSMKVLADSLLQMPDLDTSIVREFLGDINNEIDRLSRIIDRLLTLTRMDVYEEELVLKNVNVKKLLKGIVKSLQPLASRKRINLKMASAEEIHVLVDEDKLWEAVFNIVDNSIKYTPDKGRVTVGLVKSHYHVEITVEDTGIGIPEEDTQKVFDRFYRVDKARARETGGTGLGLAIAMRAIKLHDGEITVVSEEEKGSKFTITIPYREGKVTES